MLKFTSNVSEKFSLDEYVDFVYKEIDLLDIKSLQDSAWALKALSNNRELVSDSINEDMKLLRHSRLLNTYTPQSIMLSRQSDFYIRANLWAPLSQDARVREFEIPLFSYHSAHDHNFHFVTVGYWGAGYETIVYSYDYHKVTGSPGELVDMEFQGHYQLNTGDIMVYEASKDIHDQLPPSEFSVSLNLVVNKPELSRKQQFFFDLKEKSIQRFFQDSVRDRFTILEIAKFLGDAETAEVVLTVAKEHPCSRTRGAAYATLIEMCPNDRSHILNYAVKDSDQNIIKRIEIAQMLHSATSKRENRLERI